MVYRFHTGEEPGVRPVLAEDDRAGNLQSVREADRQADRTIAHVHTHAWKTDSSMTDSPAFLPPFARECIDAGADVVVCQGSDTPLRGIETYGDGVIFYDPGGLFIMSDTTAAPLGVL